MTDKNNREDEIPQIENLEELDAELDRILNEQIDDLDAMENTEDEVAQIITLHPDMRAEPEKPQDDAQGALQPMVAHIDLAEIVALGVNVALDKRLGGRYGEAFAVSFDVPEHIVDDVMKSVGDTLKRMGGLVLYQTGKECVIDSGTSDAYTGNPEAGDYTPLKRIRFVVTYV